MTIEGFLGAIIIGAVVGALARLLLPGRQPIGILWTILVGIVAALIGTLIVGSLRDTNGIDWVEVVVQIVLAMIGVAAVASMKRGRVT
jgi:uncharacterized membrane protein YeaQ/YmgE (transglycosylase-associated protein family)